MPPCSNLISHNSTSSAQLPFCDRLFSSAEGCARLWKQLGCDYNVVQVSSGPLHGRLRVDHQDGILLVSMEADQALLVEGARHPRWLPFTIEHTDNYSDHRHFGESLAPNALAGFNTKMTESLMRTSPGGNRIGAVLVDRRRVDAWAGLDGTSYVSDQMEQYDEEFVDIPTLEELYYYCKYVIITGRMEKEIPILCLIYLERFFTMTGILMTGRNWKRLTLISLILASKIWDDDSLENVHFP